jgi:hypothetical protein
MHRPHCAIRQARAADDARTRRFFNAQAMLDGLHARPFVGASKRLPPATRDHGRSQARTEAVCSAAGCRDCVRSLEGSRDRPTPDAGESGRASASETRPRHGNAQDWLPARSPVAPGPVANPVTVPTVLAGGVASKRSVPTRSVSWRRGSMPRARGWAGSCRGSIRSVLHIFRVIAGTDMRRQGRWGVQRGDPECHWRADGGPDGDASACSDKACKSEAMPLKLNDRCRTRHFGCVSAPSPS